MITFYSIVRLLVHYEIIFSIVWVTLVMYRRVVDLFAYWRGYFVNPHSVAVWKLVPSCLMLCIWRERNDRNFEDRNRTMVELKAFFFNTLYQWMAILGCFQFSSFRNFLDHFSLTSLVFLFYTSPCTWVAPLCFLINFNYLWIKKKQSISECP